MKPVNKSRKKGRNRNKKSFLYDTKKIILPKKGELFSESLNVIVVTGVLSLIFFGVDVLITGGLSLLY